MTQEPNDSPEFTEIVLSTLMVEDHLPDKVYDVLLDDGNIFMN